MRIARLVFMICFVFCAAAPSALAGDLFEEKAERGLDPAPKQQLWREEFRDRDEPLAVPKQARRSNDNLDELNGHEDADAEVDREIGSDHDADHDAGD